MKTLAIFTTVAAAQISAEDLVALLNDNELTSLAKAVGGQQEIVDTLTSDADGFTVFAPTNEVLDAAVPTVPADALPNVLSYHTSPDAFNPADAEFPAVIKTGLTSEGLTEPQVVIAAKDGDNVVIQHGAGKATVTNSVEADPSVVHVVDAVLIPPEAPSKVAAANELSALVSALTDAQLVEAVDGAKDVTIFAPTDDAFAALETTPETNITEVLLYHVVEGVAYSPALEGTQTFTSLQGSTVEVVVGDDGVTVNGANVVVADVLTSNGVVHVIDAVLSPEQGGEPDDDVAKPGAAGIVTASLTTVVAALMSLF